MAVLVVTKLPINGEKQSVVNFYNNYVERYNYIERHWGMSTLNPNELNNFNETLCTYKPCLVFIYYKEQEEQEKGRKRKEEIYYLEIYYKKSWRYNNGWFHEPIKLENIRHINLHIAAKFIKLDESHEKWPDWNMVQGDGSLEDFRQELIFQELSGWSKPINVWPK